MTEYDIIDEEHERFIKDYGEKRKVLESKNPVEEIQKAFKYPAGKGSVGLFELIGKDDKLARYLGEYYAQEIRDKTERGRFLMRLRSKRWLKRDISIVQSTIRKGGVIARLSKRLGRSANAIYKLIKRRNLRK